MLLWDSFCWRSFAAQTHIKITNTTCNKSSRESLAVDKDNPKILWMDYYLLDKIIPI